MHIWVIVASAGDVAAAAAVVVAAGVVMTLSENEVTGV
jgi:hypothetical protein